MHRDAAETKRGSQFVLHLTFDCVRYTHPSMPLSKHLAGPNLRREALLKLRDSLNPRDVLDARAPLAGVDAASRLHCAAGMARKSAIVCLMLWGQFSAAGQVSIVVSDAAGKPVIDAAVALVPAIHAAPRIPPVETSIDQVQKQFRPHVSVLQVGTIVNFPNSDNIRHQVYSFSAAKRFETKLYAGRTATPVVFDKPGVVVLGCNIHDEMRAYVYVVDTPYYAKTDLQGLVRISAPEGDYVLNVWHPRFALGRASMSHVYQITAAEQQDHEVLALDVQEEPQSPTSASLTR